MTRSACSSTRLTGALQVLDAPARRRALWRYPLMTIGVFWHIHREAFTLWRKRVPFFSKPAQAAVVATRSHSSQPPISKH
ncbi:DUF1365 family protein [Candidatus Aalborgicola defluviihabitans]|uniref:DUF1365 family protein n=1 Tax=Candidatus Aalborgicola defluviihabitans TaxID=3386187 RepID=UPI0039B91C01